MTTDSIETSEREAIEPIEREIQRKGLTAPRITPADIENAIKHIEYVKHTSAGGQVLRWAILTTQSGFAVVGAPSVAVSPENDDAEVGEKVARQNSTQALWPLLGFALKEKLASVPADHRDRVRAEAAELDERLAKLITFSKGPVFAGLPAEEQARMNEQLAAMESYSLALHDRIAAF
jgi:hypothetical protein